MIPKSFIPVLKKTLHSKCPNCGQGKLYVSFLKLAQSCSKCSENFTDIRADDAPAWLTILIVGHILAPILLLILPLFNYPDWVLILSIIVPTVMLSLIILPFAKSFFVGILWYQKKKNSKIE